LQKALRWIGDKMDKAIDSFFRAAGTTAGVAAGAKVAGVPVVENLDTVVNGVLRWLDIVTLPF